MKFFVAFVALAAVAVAVPLQKPINNDDAQLQAIMEAINNPHTDPATAALLQEQLNEILSALKPDISIDPALVDESEIIDTNPALVDGNEPISTDPAIIDGYVPAAVGSPLVQVIVNVKSAPKPAPKPVQIDNSPAIVPEEIDTSPAIVPDEVDSPAIIEPESPIIPDPINIGVPSLPDPAINLPEDLN